MHQCRGALKQNYHNKQNKQPCYPIEFKSTQQNWLVVSRAAPKEVCGYLFGSSTCNERSSHSCFVREHWESVASGKEMLLYRSRYVTGTSKRINILPPLPQREGSRLMPNGHVHWYRNNVLAASKTEEEPNYIIHFPFSGDKRLFTTLAIARTTAAAGHM